ncbi:MAG: DUF3943 domain-containing protein [Burkholderiales bacterium]|nr:DUF3943 domain-containing protein [Burkholderiales bacterium]
MYDTGKRRCAMKRSGTRTASRLRQAPNSISALCSAVLVLILFSSTAFAEEPAAIDTPAAQAGSARRAIATYPGAAPITFSSGLKLPQNSLIFDRRALYAQSNAAPAHAANIEPTTAIPAWGSEKSYLIPALEILGFDTLLNAFNRAYFGCCDYNTSFSSIRRNLGREWVVDRDSFSINQIGHPYQGSMYHGFARASGLGYWESSVYTFVGSALWEIGGETTPPSENDQIASGIGGSFLGEALFRMSNLWLEQGRGSRFWREIAAAAISPPVGFNRLASGQRFDGIFASRDAEYYSRVQFGVNSATQDQPGTAREAKRHEAVVDFALDYGLPGKSGYAYKRPFDYFTFQGSLSSAIGLESVMTRGLLIGTDYEVGKTYRGIWGLYGSYTYLAPQVFRLASTAVSVGTTAEWRLSDSIALQGTGLVGVGYATVSTIGAIEDERANNYGVAPQAATALRLIVGDRVSLDLTAREFFISDVSSGNRDGNDNVVRADASLTWRIYRQHAVSVKYQLSRRDIGFPGFGDRSQSRGTLGIFYTLLGRDRFGTGDWQ